MIAPQLMVRSDVTIAPGGWRSQSNLIEMSEVSIGLPVPRRWGRVRYSPDRRPLTRPDEQASALRRQQNLCYKGRAPKDRT